MKEDKFFYNWNILGHSNIVKYLQQIIESENFLNTYLFSGAKDIGKKTVAQYFSQSIFCTDKKNLPCGKCEECLEIQKATHPDLIFISLEEGKKNISIEQIRDFKDRFSLTPMRSKFKIGIINDADRLNQESGNALLKIIEEPPKNSLIILLSEDIDKILPTIRSRSQNIIFNNVKFQEIYNHLIKLGAEKNLSFELAKFSGGTPGVAMSFLNNLDEWEKRKEELKSTIAIMSNSINEKFDWIENQIDNSKNYDSYSFLSKKFIDFTRISRDMCVFKLNENAELIHPFLKDQIEHISEKYSEEKLIEFYKFANNAKKLIFDNVNPRLLFENLLII